MSLKRYYRLRLRGTEDYLNKHNSFGPPARAKIFSKQAASAWFAWWKNRFPQIDDVEVVEYDLIETKCTPVDQFFNKHSKSPIVST